MALAGNRNVQDELNRSMPAATHAKLGDVLFDLITAVNLQIIAVNALIANHNTLIAKLNADAGVTDVDYAASTAVATTAVAALSAR